ncbi:transcriptional repressor NrdR [Candidatus Saccharibacteria bacterium]|nr:transcriptional repressor NrdR [Candidatus Saccharibacteria bacterium]
MNPKYKIGDSRVLESREALDGTMIRRRRITSDGKYRFTTYERIELPMPTVIKKSGDRKNFDRDKLFISVKRSVGKFFNSDMEVEEVVDKTMGLIAEKGKDEISSREIGQAVLDVLAEINDVAYVRYASVFQEFKTLDDFERILKEQKEKKAKRK